MPSGTMRHRDSFSVMGGSLMAMRGEFLYNGYIPTKGVVRVFQDLDSTTHVFAMLRNGQSIYTTRDHIKARKMSSTPHRKAVEARRREAANA